MLAGVDAWYLRLLSSGDPKLVAAGLKARGGAWRSSTKPCRTPPRPPSPRSRQSEARRRRADGGPHTNLALFIATWNEKESLSGEEITKVGRFRERRLRPRLGVENSSRIRPSATASPRSGTRPPSWVKGRSARLAARFKLPPGKLKTALTWVKGGLENLRGRINGGLQTGWRRRSRICKFARGQAAKRAALADAARADALLLRIAKANLDGQKRLYRQLVLELQTNKTAQALLNSAKSPEIPFDAGQDPPGVRRLVDRNATREMLAAARNAREKRGQRFSASCGGTRECSPGTS